MRLPNYVPAKIAFSKHTLASAAAAALMPMLFFLENTVLLSIALLMLHDVIR